MKVIKVDDYQALSLTGAKLILNQIKENENCILGLATGSTPVGIYRTLVEQYEAQEISFSNVTSFNLDEYIGLDINQTQSYASFMHEHLFKHIDIAHDAVHIPSGKAENMEEECRRYEEAIKAAGGIDIQILGIGRNGHIGFNEPNIQFASMTHIVNLDEKTIADNARFFEKPEDVPRTAISMGIKTIMSAKKIVLLASGKEKAQALYGMIHGKITPELPASVLQLHNDVTIVCDRDAAILLGD